ncbi:hypothetical protein CWI36_0624p0020 [Hamiltosporidium magnivora]|uniref:Uncharacterized protein n=1 Tax=Hamiltosporidium magnivora TaxID=148818 RepID=A0A4Q9LCF0_9MICR|nr:hypothetical protein CWI36_0624p0020 [Hamiltosporidium magnivora]
MSLYLYFGKRKEPGAKKSYLQTFVVLICFYFPLCFTTVSFFILNDQNTIYRLNAIDLTLEMSKIENKPMKYFIGEDIITRFENNILGYEFANGRTKYYNPNILTIPYENDILLSSNFIKTLFESKQTNINIFLKDVSHYSLVLFIKLIENPDIIVNQIRIQEFLDILIIISILDIKKSKERNDFLKELLKNFMFTMEEVNLTFDFEKFCESNHHKYIKKSILMDLLIFYFDFITFNDKSAERCMILSGNKYLRFNSCDILFNTYISYKKGTKRLYLRLNDISIKKIYKMLGIGYLLNTWRLLLCITEFDLLYLMFSEEYTNTKARKLFNDVTFHTKKLYNHFTENLIRLFSKKQLSVFSTNLKVLKLEFNSSADELKKILLLSKNLQKLTLSTKNFDFERLRLLVNFSLENPKILCSIYSLNYKFRDIDFEFLNDIPNNCMFYADNFTNESKKLDIDIQYKQFVRLYRYSYDETSNFTTNFVHFEWSKYKYIELNYGSSSTPLKLDNSVFKSLSYMNTIKYFLLQNIVITDELLLFVLRSTTIVYFRIRTFIYTNDYRFISDGNIINQKLAAFDLINSYSPIHTSLLVYLKRFRNVEVLKLKNICINHTELCFREIFKDFSCKNLSENKIYLKSLKIITDIVNEETTNYLDWLSNVYAFSDILSIYYYVYRISRTEYLFLNKMARIELLSIRINHKSDFIDFKMLFTDCNFFNTINFFSFHCKAIRKEDINILKKIKILKCLSLSCETIDYEIISCFKRKDFKTTKFEIYKPIRSERSAEINEYLDTEFKSNFS